MLGPPTLTSSSPFGFSESYARLHRAPLTCEFSSGRRDGGRQRRFTGAMQVGASSEGLCSRRTWPRKAQRMRCSGGAGARAFRALAQLDGRCRGRWIRRQKKLLVSICKALAQCGGTRSKDRGAATRRGMMQRGPEPTLGVQRLEMAATTQLWGRSSGLVSDAGKAATAAGNDVGGAGDVS